QFSNDCCANSDLEISVKIVSRLVKKIRDLGCPCVRGLVQKSGCVGRQFHTNRLNTSRKRSWCSLTRRFHVRAQGDFSAQVFHLFVPARDPQQLNDSGCQGRFGPPSRHATSTSQRRIH